MGNHSMLRSADVLSPRDAGGCGGIARARDQRVVHLQAAMPPLNPRPAIRREGLRLEGLRHGPPDGMPVLEQDLASAQTP